MTRGAGLAATLLAAGAGVLAGPASAGAATVAASQPLVVVLADQVARTGPRAGARPVETVDARRPLTGVRTVLPLLGDARDRAGEAWVRVRLPGRPSGHTGWIRARRTRRTATAWHLVVDLSARRVIVYRAGRAGQRFLAVVGKPSTPTPRGAFFIEEGVALPSHAGGPYALATSARSDVLQQFEGGPGQIALHGTQGLSGARGTAASHGCIRLSTRAITWLAEHIGAGVPLTIRR
ncbi:MAG: hypothetical protein QOE65_603 [Solirubrobacteraceae bacterium]|jgi:lipoprotein-anchoring transpeptidase ErfK/SrfK|nr:hypothetical protein [Solirubrobacteraceae bacterium]